MLRLQHIQAVVTSVRLPIIVRSKKI